MVVAEQPIKYPAARKSLADGVYDQILALIMQGTWPERSRLPSEVDLVAEFKISRPVVRKALARLRENGLIVSRQGSGSFVRELDATQPNVHFPAIDSIADFELFLTFREGLEGEAAAAAAGNEHNDRLIGELRRAAAQSRHVDRIAAEGDFLFHLAVAQASGNPFYVSTLTSLKSHFLFGMNLMRSFTGRQVETDAVVSQQHSSIAEAIICQKPERARELMRSHLQSTRNRLLTGAKAPLPKL